MLKRLIKKIISPASPVQIKKTYVDPVVNNGGKHFEINNWVISDFVINELVPVVGFHPFPLNELMLLSSAVTYFKPKLIFDWGTHVGKSARIFYETTKAFNIDAEVHSIDLPEEVDHVEHPHEQRGMLVKHIPEVTLHLGDGVETAIKVYKEKNEPESVLFLLDGDHSYETVKREIAAISAAIKNPVMIIHDTFNQTEESKYNVGPYKAIEESIAGKGYSVVNTHTGLPGMTLIYKK